MFGLMFIEFGLVYCFCCFVGFAFLFVGCYLLFCSFACLCGVDVNRFAGCLVYFLYFGYLVVWCFWVCDFLGLVVLGGFWKFVGLRSFGFVCFVIIQVFSGFDV